MLRSVAIAILFWATATTVSAQLNPIVYTTIPSLTRVQLKGLNAERYTLAADNVAAAVNSYKTAIVVVKADGNVTAKVVLTHTGDRNANHTVKVELLKPNRSVAAVDERVIVRYNTPTEITLTATASIAESGCDAANNWLIRVRNTDDVNEQTTRATYILTTPSATSTRQTYPDAAFSLIQGASIDRVFSIPGGHSGTVTIKTAYTGTAPIKLHLFKPGAIPTSLLGAVKTQYITATGQAMSYTVNATDVAAGAEDTFWHIAGLNTGTGAADSNIRYTVEFVDCFE